MDWNALDLEYFKKAEFTCHCGCGRADMDPNFMRWLDKIRRALRRPMRVTSGFRCPQHNATVSSTGLTGPHTTGKAVDIGVSGEGAFMLLSLAMGAGVQGVGVKQNGSHAGRFLHLDMLTHDEAGTRPWVWSY
jgi:zinc D-Ala-D-Ala carboxypeptidase